MGKIYSLFEHNKFVSKLLTMQPLPVPLLLWKIPAGRSIFSFRNVMKFFTVRRFIYKNTNDIIENDKEPVRAFVPFNGDKSDHFAPNLSEGLKSAIRTDCR